MKPQEASDALLRTFALDLKSSFQNKGKAGCLHFCTWASYLGTPACTLCASRATTRRVAYTFFFFFDTDPWSCEEFAFYLQYMWYPCSHHGSCLQERWRKPKCLPSWSSIGAHVRLQKLREANGGNAFAVNHWSLQNCSWVSHLWERGAWVEHFLIGKHELC